jgi:hypothetical protein
MPWNDSWNEHQRKLCATGAFRALRRDICAGRALLAPQRSSFNPWVQGSSPWRPTCEIMDLLIFVRGTNVSSHETAPTFSRVGRSITESDGQSRATGNRAPIVAVDMMASRFADSNTERPVLLASRMDESSLVRSRAACALRRELARHATWLLTQGRYRVTPVTAAQYLSSRSWISRSRAAGCAVRGFWW